MNVETGELFNLSEEDRESIEEAIKESIHKVPKRLQKEAEKELAGQRRVVVNMSRDTPLTQWAHSKRTSPKRKRKIAQASKKRNRRNK